MKRRKWMTALVFAGSMWVGWAGSATAVECLYPYVTKLADLELLEMTRDGESVEDLSAYRTEEGRYGVRGYPFGIQMFYEAENGNSYRVSFAGEEK